MNRILSKDIFVPVSDHEADVRVTVSVEKKALKLDPKTPAKIHIVKAYSEYLENHSDYTHASVVNLAIAVLQDIMRDNTDSWVAIAKKNLILTTCKINNFLSVYCHNSDTFSFAGIQLPILPAMMPSLISDQIQTVQSLDRRAGQVFYMNVVTGRASVNNEH